MNSRIEPVYETDRLMMWRGEVIRTVFGVDPTEDLLAANRNYYERHIADGSHLAVGAEVDGREAGCGAICFTEELPSPDNPSGRCAYLMNIYVRPMFRSRGIGHEIVSYLVEKAREKRCDKIYLETTDEARSLYNSIGFKELPGILKYADIQHR